MLGIAECLDELNENFIKHDNIKPKNFIFIKGVLKTEDFNLFQAEIEKI